MSDQGPSRGSEAEAHLAFANQLLEKQLCEEAEAEFRKVLKLQPNDPEAHYYLANILSARGEGLAAEQHYRAALASSPAFTQALNNLGCLLERQEKLDQAASCYRMSAAACADYPEARLNLGQLLHRCGQNDEAEFWYREAARLRPDYRDAHFGLGLLLKNQNRFHEAENEYRAALKADPLFFPALTNLGIVLRTTGRLQEALDCYRTALAVAPESAQSLQNLLFLLGFLPGFDEQKRFEEHCRFGEQFGKSLSSGAAYNCSTTTPDRPLRIGFVSGDFREHPVYYLFAPVLTCHDRKQISMICYSNVAFPDRATERLRELADDWRDISRITDDQAAALVAEDRIDILVDLAGHTAGNRLLLFTRKAAPVQVEWLGYWDTSGLPAMDFILSDRITTPEETNQHFVEQVVKLPTTRFCWEGISSAPSPAAPPCLANGFITFGCFNSLPKINDNVICLWSRLLERLPDSRLVLKSVAFADDPCRQRLLDQFAAYGVAGTRMTLLQVSGHLEMLEQYSLVDIALDTFPFPGGITTMEALWMGVPVIALTGRSMIGRQADSLLTAAGLQQFIAGDAEGYLELAARLAGNVEYLKMLRQNLRRQVTDSSLMDAAGFTRHLEEAFHIMWRTRGIR